MRWGTVVIIVLMFGGSSLSLAQSGIDFSALAADGGSGVWIGGSAFDAKGLLLNSTANRVRALTANAFPFIEDISFVNSRLGWAAGAGYLYKTANAGKTWRKLKIGLGTQRLASVNFLNAQTGWAAGQAGLILITRDGGRTWRRQTSGTDFSLETIRFVNQRYGWAMGSDISHPPTRKILLLTSDGGLTWRKARDSDFHQFRDVFFLESHLGWAIDQNDEILQTIDGGETWRVQRSANGKCDSIFFVNRAEGWSVGDGILHTSDGGKTWKYQLKTSGSPGEYLNKVIFVNPKNGWVINLFKILVTRDGGVTWGSLSDSWRADVITRLRREKLKPTSE
jgi:photosystem II stability/assembly factor-like uncharacterized protein